MSDEMEAEDKELMNSTDPDSISVSSSYKGPHVTFPITQNSVFALLQAFKTKQVSPIFPQEGWTWFDRYSIC